MIDHVSLKQHVALVTGASRGIGRAIAQRLAAHGAAVVLNASPRSVAGLRETAELIEKSGGRASWVEADLADETERANLIARASENFGPVDILINNTAGISSYAPPSKMDLATSRAMIALNYGA